MKNVKTDVPAKQGIRNAKRGSLQETQEILPLGGGLQGCKKTEDQGNAQDKPFQRKRIDPQGGKGMAPSR